MKFASVLRDSAAVLPDTDDLFRKYKQLKKSLKRMRCTDEEDRRSRRSGGDEDDDDDSPSTTPTGHPSSPRLGAVSGPAGEPNTSQVEEPSAKRPRRDSEAMLGAEGDPPCTAANETTNTYSVVAPEGDPGPASLSPAAMRWDPALEAEFLRAITADVMELNDRYIEREEDNVMKLEQLMETIEAAKTSESKAAVHRAFVDFHGELLLLLHWSILAYTGLVKILKKHRKRTGSLLHAPHLENLLAQPFCSVEVTCDMIRKAEQHVNDLSQELWGSDGQQQHFVAPVQLELGALMGGNGSEAETSPQEVLAAAAAAVIGEGGPPDQLAATPEAPAQSHVPDTQAAQRVRAALRVWQQLQRNVSTPSTRIAGGGVAGGPLQRVAPSDMTKSSIA